MDPTRPIGTKEYVALTRTQRKARRAVVRRTPDAIQSRLSWLLLLGAIVAVIVMFNIDQTKFIAEIIGGLVGLTILAGIVYGAGSVLFDKLRGKPRGS